MSPIYDDLFEDVDCKQKGNALNASKKCKEYDQNILFITSLLSHIMISTRTHVVRNSVKTIFSKASEQTLDRQQQKLTLYANIPILLKDSAYTNINIIV